MTFLRSTVVAAMLLAIGANPAFAQQARAEWAKAVHASILNQVRYPPVAGLQYRLAIVEFRVAPTGKLLSRRIQQSSGHAVFDKAALAAIDHASPFPPFPPQMKERTGAVLRLPVIFHGKRPQTF
jgi:protein TonB